MALSLILNGQPRTFETLPEGANLTQVVEELGLKGDRVAVELNGEIVTRPKWGEAVLNGGDRLEVVHFVGGGA